MHFHVFLPILQYAYACTAICSMQAQLLSLHNTQTTLLLSQLLGLSHMMILSMQQPCVLDLSLAMLQDVCQYTYFLEIFLDLRDIFPRMSKSELCMCSMQVLTKFEMIERNEHIELSTFANM